MTVVRAELVQTARQQNVLPTIIDDFLLATFAPPLQRFQTVAAFVFAKSRRATIAQSGTKTRDSFQVEHQIEVGQGAQLEIGERLQHAKIEAATVETNDAIGCLQFPQKFIDLLAPKSFENRFAIRVIIRGARNNNRDSQLLDIAPATDFFRRALGFDIEINPIHKSIVLWRRAFPLLEMRAAVFPDNQRVLETGRLPNEMTNRARSAAE